mmetsp:Transcript_124192/g.232315  ORF Transcript_124192/g.232315 Transcript_124192/m.232315 type:complete len:100 (-) Transcript_124192:1222-1521(-)
MLKMNATAASVTTNPFATLVDATGVGVGVAAGAPAAGAGANAGAGAVAGAGVTADGGVGMGAVAANASACDNDLISWLIDRSLCCLVLVNSAEKAARPA